MTERARLTDALALAARPREREYAIHDAALQGFMLQVQPNGARSWVFRFRRDGEPRAAALVFLAREKGGGNALPLSPSGPTLTKFTAEYVEWRSPSWKPSTVTATMSYLSELRSRRASSPDSVRASNRRFRSRTRVVSAKR